MTTPESTGVFLWTVFTALSLATSVAVGLLFVVWVRRMPRALEDLHASSFRSALAVKA